MPGDRAVLAPARGGVAGRLLWLLLFAAAFGVVEAAVVVYLRALYFPGGFDFPFTIPDPAVLRVELAREAATLLVLLGGAAAAERTGWGRFGAFAYVFGVWDLAYYAGLWAALGWPESLFTWDILFLLPRWWAGPVLSAALVAASLVAAGGVITVRAAREEPPRAGAPVWVLAALSIGLLLGAFTANHDGIAAGGSPERFPWWLWTGGFAAGWGAFALAYRRRPARTAA